MQSPFAARAAECGIYHRSAAISHIPYSVHVLGPSAAEEAHRCFLKGIAGGVDSDSFDASW